MDGRRVTFLILLLATPAALAQDPDPTVNDSDFNTTTPAEDESYLDEAEAESTEDPSVSDADFDTSTPPMDESYLEEEAAGGGSGNGAAASAKATPAPAAVLVLAGLAATALLLRRPA